MEIVALGQGDDHDLQVVAIQANRAALADDDEEEVAEEKSEDEESGE